MRGLLASVREYDGVCERFNSVRGLTVSVREYDGVCERFDSECERV